MKFPKKISAADSAADSSRNSTTEAFGKGWKGPRLWPADLKEPEVVARLQNMARYRAWAKAGGNLHMVVSRADVIGLLNQVRASHALADIVFKGDTLAAKADTPATKAGSVQSTEPPEADADDMP